MKTKLDVTRRGLTQRLSRILSTKNLVLRRSAGRDVLIDTAKGVVVNDDLNLEDYARKIGVLKEWEKLSR